MGQPKSYQVIAFNKPYGVLSQFTSEHNHPSLESFNFPPGVYPVGRLDRDSEGLLLLSDNGELISKILEPKKKFNKTYLAQVENIPNLESLSKLERGVMIKSGMTRPCQVSDLGQIDIPERTPPIRERKSIPTTWLKITLQEGKNRQVRRMTASIGHPTLRLIRVSIGNLNLEELNLKPGQWSYTSILA